MARFFIFSFILLFAVASVGAQVETRRTTSQQYAGQWKVIEGLMDGILPQSALPEIEKVRQVALNDKAYGQLIKAVMTRNTCLRLTEEKPQVAIINNLKRDAETVPFPAKAVVYLLTGEAYLHYYNQNRWALYERTALAEGAESDDIETWDATRLIREIVHYYQLSLAEPEMLQKTSIGDFREALEGDASTRYLRPTLYDFLAHHAIDTYMNRDLWIAGFSQMHFIEDPAYFGDAHNFVHLTIPETDTLAPTYLILKLFQELTAFRLTQNDLNPLVDVNLKRFNYLKEHGNFEDVDALYEDAMKYLIKTCAGQRIWGKAALTLAIYYQQQGGERPGKNVLHRRRYLVDAVNLCREIEKTAPLRDDRKPATDMIQAITQPAVSLSVEKNLIPHQPALALVAYKNVTIAYLNLYRCNQDELEEFQRSGNMNDAPQFLSKQEKVASQTLHLPLQTDYQEHSFETKIDALQAGNYLLVVSDKPYPEKDKLTVLNFHTVQITNIKLLQRYHGEEKTEAYVMNARSGKPLTNAQITMMGQIYDREQSKYTYIHFGDTLHTDTCGIALLPNFNRSSYKIHVAYDGDELTENILSGNLSRQPNNILRTVFFTDRAIYRPGQTVCFKGLLYETDNDGHNAIKPNTKTTVQLIDVNGKEVTKLELTTNEYGSFNSSFTLPQGLLNGRMRLRNEHGSVGISVEEYKRPTFEITMNPVTAGYMLGDTVTMTGVVSALAGYPVDGAKVSYNVVRQQQFRPVRWMIYPPRKNDRQVASGTLYTDGKGGFSVRFPAMADDIKLNDNSFYRFELMVDVTDINGETQSDKQGIALSHIPLVVDWQPHPLPLSTGEEGSDVFEYPLKITNLNGNDVAAEVRVEVWSVKSPDRLLRHRLWQQPDTTVMSYDEFSEFFSNDPYLDEDQPATYEKIARVATFQVNTPKDSKIDLSMLRDAPAGWYYIKIQATGGQKNATITDSAYIQLRHGNSPIMHMNEWLTVVKEAGEPGETAVFRIAGGNDSSLVRYDILFKNEVVERKWLTVGRIPQELHVPVTETFRGGFAVAFAMVQDNRVYSALQEIKVPYTNQELDIAFTTFRGQLLPGEKEKWTLTVKNKKGESEAAEMVAALYDASLDMFAKHGWTNYFYPTRSHWQYGWNRRFAPLSDSRNLIVRDIRYFWSYQQDYERLYQENWNGMWVKSMALTRSNAESDDISYFAESASAPSMMDASNDEATVAGNGTGNKDEEVRKENLTSIPLRTNFSETAFFYPELRTNDKGEIWIEFTIPEALTRWNMLGFAHTKDFKAGNVANSLITQKQVAISANLPRFFRTGDTLVLSAKVNNITDKDLTGNALLRLYDAFTMQPVDAQMLKTAGTQPFVVKAGQSATVQWRLVVPATLQAVTYRLTAQAGNHTDGEERSVPVLSNRTLVTETMPFMVRGDDRKDFRFSRLADYTSATLKHQRVTLEYTSNPAWYAVQALPYLMEYPYECAEQIFTRFYANALATTVANSSPGVRQIFNQWRGLSRVALISNLEKNQELKQALLEETPWVMQAANETERKKRIALLFDLNRMANEQTTALDKLKAMQGGNGGFPWFANMPEERFVTQHIVAGLEHLRKLNALPRTGDVSKIIERALAYCDARINEDYNNAQRRDVTRRVSAESAVNRDRNRDRPQINSIQIHYLYVCSFSRHYSPNQQAFDFYMQQAERSWTQVNIYEQAMIALTMYRFGKPDVAQNILRSLKERAQMSDDMGMYWTENRSGYFWNELPVETQAMLIEVFNEAGSDTHAVNEMKIWLLRNRQTNDWKTTKATSQAIYALLSTGDDLLTVSTEPLDIRINGKPLKNITKTPLRPEAGTGYVNVTWNDNDVNKSLANLRVANPNSGIAWGAMYWQYFEDMDKITSAETNLQMSKQLFIKRRNLPLTSSQGGGRILEPVTGNNCPQVGDVVTVRLELRADRDFEYVHLKDMRAAGFEPVNVQSGYRYRDGLGYYESIRDASVNFFISYLRRGTYVFEYDLRVANTGDFSNGITTFQCMYAPEFNAHSEGVRVKIKED